MEQLISPQRHRGHKEKRFESVDYTDSSFEVRHRELGLVAPAKIENVFAALVAWLRKLRLRLFCELGVCVVKSFL